MEKDRERSLSTLCCMVMLAALILLLSSCGRNNESIGNDQQQENEVLENIPTETVEPGEPEPPRPLSILAPDDYRFIINNTAARNQFPIELTTYPPARRDETLERFGVMIMAGDAYDMFVLDGHSLFDLSRMGFLADFNALIDEDPHVNRDDFFTEALRAWEIDGGLYAFPMNFGFNYVFINSSLPESVIERFAGHSTITIPVLMDIYNSLKAEYPLEFDHLNFSDGSGMLGVSPRWILHSQLSYFVDFDNMSANFSDERLIGVLDNYMSIFGASDAWDVTSRFTHGLVSPVRRMANYNVFWVATGCVEPGFAFIDVQPYFLHGIPLADNQGRLLICGINYRSSGNWGEVCIVNTDNKQKAWEFTQLLIPRFSQINDDEALACDSMDAVRFWGVHSISSSIRRDLFDPHIRSAFNFLSRVSLDIGASIPEATLNEAIANLAALSEMPMAVGNLSIPEDLYMEHLDQLRRGLISSEDFAQRLQNSFSLWLMGG